jgi:hypothetical protein
MEGTIDEFNEATEKFFKQASSSILGRVGSHLSDYKQYLFQLDKSGNVDKFVRFLNPYKDNMPEWVKEYL